MRSPFKFLDSYVKGDELQYGFFGRDGETQDLYDLVMRTNLALVYGVTGVGKSSLVRCGLANRIDESRWFDLYVRRGSDINQSLRAAVQAEIDRRLAARSQTTTKTFGGKLFGKTAAQPTGDAQKPTDSQSIGVLLDKLYLHAFKPVYIVFDQFEEIFTLGDHEERTAFFETLRDMQEADAHKVKVVLVMREEYFAYLDEYERVLPTLTRHRLRVERMSRKNLHEVVVGSLEKASIAYDAAVPAGIITRLAPREKDTVELTHLQMLLDKLYRLAGEGKPFTAETLQQAGELRDIVGEFIDERVQEIASADGDSSNDEAQRTTMWAGLKLLITPQGTKQPQPQNTLPHGFPATEMEQAGILRIDPDSGVAELTHDILAAAIFARLSTDERELNDARLDIEKALDLHQKGKRGLLDKDQLAYHQRYAEHYTEPQRAFIAQSDAALRAAEAADRRRTRIVFAFGIAASIAAVVAVWLFFNAQAATKRAEAEKKKAQQALIKVYEKEQNELVRKREAFVKADEPSLVRQADSLVRVFQTKIDSLIQ